MHVAGVVTLRGLCASTRVDPDPQLPIGRHDSGLCLSRVP